MRDKPTRAWRALPGLICAATLAASPARAFAQPGDGEATPTFLSRPDLVRSLVAHNPELRAAGVSLDMARARAAGAGSPFDWTLESGADVRQSLSPDPFNPAELRRRTTAETYLQVTRLLRTGTQLRLRAAEAFTEYPLYQMSGVPSTLELTIPGEVIGPGLPDLTFPVTMRNTAPPGPRSARYFGATTDVSIVQPLLRDASAAVLDAPERTARASRRRAEAARRQIATQVIAQTLRLAAELSLAHDDRSLRLAARDLALEELEVTQAKIAAGQLAEIAELQIRQTIAEREEAALLAERTIGELDVELRRALGLALAPGIAPITPETPRSFSAPQRQPAVLVERALSQAPEVMVARASVEEARANLAATNNRLLPRLDASAGVGVIAQEENGLDVWERMFGVRDGFNWHLGLAFSMPLENREARMRAEEGRLALTRAEHELEDVETRLRVEVVKGDRALAAARKRCRVATLSRDLAARSAEGEAERYHLGLTTAHDLLDAQERQRASELTLRRAQVDRVLAEMRLLEISGDLLDVLGISLAR